MCAEGDITKNIALLPGKYEIYQIGINQSKA